MHLVQKCDIMCSTLLEEMACAAACRYMIGNMSAGIVILYQC